MRGKPVYAAIQEAITKDHPRACGENPPSGGILPLCWGSPPRMRGKLYTIKFLSADVGITPAHAGKTAYVNRGWAGAEDHPRACGENPCQLPRRCAAIGSPPRMRGKRQSPAPSTCCRGITPAHAGKTAPKYVRLQCEEDHPRACGENCSRHSACAL